MEIISWQFLLFSTGVIVIYYALNQRAQNIWLVIASSVFVASHGWLNLIPLAVITCVSFLIGKKLQETHSFRWLAGGIAISLTAFLYFRVVSSPIISLPFTVDRLLVPLGFSFYILQVISYLIDIYRGRIRAEQDMFSFSLYLLYFPKFLAGPIERAGNFLPQANRQRRVDNRTFTRAFSMIIAGLFRKVAIAEVLFTLIPSNFVLSPVSNIPILGGNISTHIYTYLGAIHNADRLVGLLAYGIFLYNDFAGYTLLMRGISLLMGFELSPNFRQPYLAVSLSDFWSRWHISLSSWLRDYVYFPLTRRLRLREVKRFSIVTVAMPLFATMLAAGAWHGLTIPFLLWGLTYSLLMTAEQLIFQYIPGLRPAQGSIFHRALSRLSTFLLVMIVWLPFAAGSLEAILTFVKAIFQPAAWTYHTGFSYWVFILTAVSFLADLFQARYNDEFLPKAIPQPLLAGMLAVVFLILVLAFTWISPYSSNVFIYQGF